jgi:hypothetical protein
MANSNVFTGADGSITLSAPPANGTVDGKAAQDIINAYEMISVGRVQNVTVEIRSDVKAFHEIGQRYATELRPGNIDIRGTIGRAYINGAMLKMLLGEAADKRPAGTWMQPNFNITLLIQNPASPKVRNTLTLHDVRIDSWVYTMLEDDFVLESVTFKALYMNVQDEA